MTRPSHGPAGEASCSADRAQQALEQQVEAMALLLDELAERVTLLSSELWVVKSVIAKQFNHTNGGTLS